MVESNRFLASPATKSFSPLPSTPHILTTFAKNNYVIQLQPRSLSVFAALKFSGAFLNLSLEQFALETTMSFELRTQPDECSCNKSLRPHFSVRSRAPREIAWSSRTSTLMCLKMQWTMAPCWWHIQLTHLQCQPLGQMTRFFWTLSKANYLQRLGCQHGTLQSSHLKRSTWKESWWAHIAQQREKLL